MSRPLFCPMQKKICFYLLLCLFLGSLHPKVLQARNTSVANNASLTLDSVSVTPDNKIIIGWTLETEATEGFVEIHRRLDSGQYIILDQVPLSQSFYIDETAQTQQKPYSYLLVARHPNDDNIAVSLEAHQNIFQKIPDPQVCCKFLIVSWNNYLVTTAYGQPLPLPLPFDSTRIWMSFEGEEYVLEAVAATETREVTLRAEEAGRYCVKIQMIHNATGVTSTSNTRCLQVNFAPVPDFLHVRKVSVNSATNHVEVLVHADNSVPNPAYVLKRYLDQYQVFDHLDTIVSGEAAVWLTDTRADAHERIESYKVAALDSCRAVALVTDSIATVYAHLRPLSVWENEIQWNPYNGWENGVSEYIVQRKLPVYNEFENIVSLPQGSNTYIDDLSFVDESLLRGNVLYRILAVENGPNQLGYLDTVSSNTIVLERDAEVFIPSAFRPESTIPENRFFKPMFPFFVPQSYSMVILNRWGEEIFSTQDEKQPWDGRKNGHQADAGVYAYIIKFKDDTGRSWEKKGAVVLIR